MSCSHGLGSGSAEYSRINYGQICNPHWYRRCAEPRQCGHRRHYSQAVLKSIKRTGFGEHLFDGWRYLDEGEPGMDCSKRPLNPDFELNKPEFKGGTVLVAGPNFGCGSSREHAPWALQQYGFKAVISSSFADIFFNNCFKNGFLPIVLKEEELKEIFAAIDANLV